MEDIFVTEWATGGVSVENGEKREETDLAEAGAVSWKRRIVFGGRFGHLVVAQAVKRGMLVRREGFYKRFAREGRKYRLTRNGSDKKISPRSPRA
jgi:hypothetical protein